MTACLTLIQDPFQLHMAGKDYPFCAETRPGRVKRLGFEPRADCCVGQDEVTVRWLFKSVGDRDRFFLLHQPEVLLIGKSPAPEQNRPTTDDSC